MRILLVRPPAPKHTVGLRHIMICEPLELEYVAAGLEGHDVQIMDLLLERQFEQRLTEFRPDVVGTSSYINGVNEVKRVCRTVKHWNPNCTTVVGGVHASQIPEDFCDWSVDCIVRGDGTSYMKEVVGHIENGMALDDIPGLALPSADGSSMHLTAQQQCYMRDPDSLPFPRRDLVAHLRDRYYYLVHQPVTIVKTTWGCWYKCNFCSTWKITDGTPYSRKPESIAAELEAIETEDVYIVDDIFLINRTRLMRLAEILRRRGIFKKYLVYGRSDFIAQNEDVISEWANIGLTAVIIGLEAATDHELQSMNKRNSVQNNRRAVEILTRNGIDTYASLITGPNYMPDDWKRLEEFIFENDLYFVNISPLTPLPGTEIWDSYENRITVPREAHGLWDLAHCVLPTAMPLKEYYRNLTRVYVKTVMNIRRAHRVILRGKSVSWSRKYFRMWLGGIRILFQFLGIHRHHSLTQLKAAMDQGTEFRRELLSIPDASSGDGQEGYSPTLRHSKHSSIVGSTDKRA